MSTRTKRATRQVGNVVPLRPVTETPAKILASVRDRRQRAEQTILDRLTELNAILEQRNAEHLKELPAIGRALLPNVQNLLDWIEVGRRMAGQGSRA